MNLTFFAREIGGQFAPAQGGQFGATLYGQLQRRLQ
jgi:hypothetical protein